MDNHIEVSHPPDQFGQHLEFDSYTENTTVVRHDPDGEDITANLLNIEPRASVDPPIVRSVKSSAQSDQLTPKNFSSDDTAVDPSEKN